MDRERQIQMLEKVLLQLDCEFVGIAKEADLNRSALIVMYSLASTLQEIVGKETFKKLLFETFYDFISSESVYADEEDNILNSFKESFKFHCNDWDKYVKERKGFPSI